MINVAYDVEFGWAVNAAARGNPDDLTNILRSDRHLGPGERDLLAKLIAGELKATTGGRPKGITALTGDQQRAIAYEYERRLQTGKAQRNSGESGEKYYEIVESLCEKYNVKTTTIREAIKEARPRRI